MRLVLSLLVSAALAGSASSQCVISSIDTLDFGVGTGFLAPAELKLSLDAASCELVADIDAPTCCNTFVSQHFLVFGALVDPIALGDPFLAGSDLRVFPLALGPTVAGTSSRYAIPSNPNLVGKSVDVQAVPFFFTTIGLTTDLGVSQAVHLTLL